MSGVLKIGFDSEQHKKLLDAIRRRFQISRNKMSERYPAFAKAEDQFVAYLPAKDADTLRKQARDVRGEPQYTTIEIPYSYAQLLAAHTYWTSVFLSRDPILQFQGRHGETEDSVQAIEAVVDYQLSVGRALVPLYIWLLDPGKYGFGVLGSYWAEEYGVISEIIEAPQSFLGIPTGKIAKVRQSRKVEMFSGTKVYNVRPQDFFPDPRVTIGNLQQGEFVGRYVEVGWNNILRGESDGRYYNIEKLRETKAKEMMKEQGSPRAETPNVSGTLDYSGNSNDTKNLSDRVDYVGLLEFHWELVPADWGLGSSTYPEKWVFTVGNYDVIISAQPLGMNHNLFPFFVLEYETEGYSFFKRGMLEMVKPLNDVITWLFNSHFYNVRKVLNDQFVIDPSRIVMRDALDANPGRMMRLKPEAYGTDPSTAIHQLQVVDVTQNNIRDISMVADIIHRITGANDTIMGMVNAGGRKTATEVRTSSTFGVNRLKTNAEYFSAQGWSLLGQTFVQNSQQKMDVNKMYRIAGNLMQRANRFVNVTPESISGFYDFVPVDGTLPVDRFAMATVWNQIMAQMRTAPSLMMQYDLGAIFAHVASLAGVKNLNSFRFKVVPDEQALQAAQVGNALPMKGQQGGRSSGGGPSASTGIPGAAQLQGMGPAG